MLKSLHIISPIDEVAQWPLDMSKEPHHPQNDGPGNTGYQTTRPSQEDMAPTDQGRRDGRWCYPGGGPIQERVEKKDTANP